MLKAITAFGICIAAANITPAFASENIATTSNTTAHRVAVDPANKPWSPETPSGFQRNNTGWIYARLSKAASDQCEAREGYECSKEPVSYTHLTLPTTPYV